MKLTFNEVFERTTNSIDEYYERKNHLVSKIVETEYMIGVIEKTEVKNSKRFYMQFNVTDLKRKLITCLNDFAEAETHRDFNCEYAEN